MNHDELVNALVGTKPSIYQPNDSPAVKVRRKFRNNGGGVSTFSRINGSAKAGDIAATAITAERLAGVGCDGEFVEQNRAAFAKARARQYSQRESVKRAQEQNEQGSVEDAEPEDQEFFEAQESAPVEERRHARPVGLEAVNAEYAKRKGINIARVS